MKLVTKDPSKTAEILDCSEELTYLAKEVFNKFKKEFAEYSNITPSLHRALQHSKEFISKYQSEGFTIGELSETAQEAFNFDDKANVRDFSYRGSFKQQNIDTIHRNWTASNPLTYFHMIQ